RQRTSLITVFAIALPGGALSLSFFHQGVEREARRLGMEHDRETDELFACVRAVGQQQAVVQQLVREKDPDRVESLIAQDKTLAAETLSRIGKLADASRRLTEE